MARIAGRGESYRILFGYHLVDLLSSTDSAAADGPALFARFPGSFGIASRKCVWCCSRTYHAGD